jgi:hypothetical protein
VQCISARVIATRYRYRSSATDCSAGTRVSPPFDEDGSADLISKLIELLGTEPEVPGSISRVHKAALNDPAREVLDRPG